MTEKGAFIDNLADEADTEAVIQHRATMYHIPKTVDGGFKNNDITMRDADGVVTTTLEKRTQLWKTHF